MCISTPASNAGKEAWSTFYVRFADELNEQLGYDAVSATLDYFSKMKKRAVIETALAKLGCAETAAKAKPKATPKASPTAAAPTTDPVAMLTAAFLAGKLSTADFTAAVAALKAGEEQPEATLDLTGTDDDLPF